MDKLLEKPKRIEFSSFIQNEIGYF